MSSRPVSHVNDGAFTMSGFGGGNAFGTHNPFGFGQPHHQQQMQQQQMQQQQPPHPVPGFGTSHFPNQNTNAPGQFANHNVASNNPFGTPRALAQQQNPPSMFGTTASNDSLFGQPSGASPGPFGQQPSTSEGPQSSGTTPISSFGTTPHSGSNVNPFGQSAATTTFPAPQIQNQSQTTSSVPNPFVVNTPTVVASATPMISFGVSSNVADDSEMMNTGSNSPVPTTWTNSLFSPGLPQPEVDMGDEKKAGPLSNLPFGAPLGYSEGTTRPKTAGWNTTNSVSIPFQNPMESTSEAAAGTISPIMVDAPSLHTSEIKKEQAPSSNTESARLAELKAKIEKKKKILEEKKRTEGKHNGQSTADGPVLHDNDAQNKDNPSVPSDSNGGDQKRASSLAERNALRFASSSGNQTTQSLLPSDLHDETPTDYSALRQTQTGAQDLGSAKSLVGKCLHMCPAEELLRRQRESDIQLLELVRPGDLHPEGWTLRDTVVKRFRRSAADYKLDVPEWVRPPDVLERVCGYLEEWVMVRSRICLLYLYFLSNFSKRHRHRNAIDKVLILVSSQHRRRLTCTNLSGIAHVWFGRTSFCRITSEQVVNVMHERFGVTSA